MHRKTMPGLSRPKIAGILPTALLTIAAAIAVMAISMRPMAHGTAFILGIITLVGMVTAGAPVYQRAWQGSTPPQHQHAYVSRAGHARRLKAAFATLSACPASAPSPSERPLLRLGALHWSDFCCSATGWRHARGSVRSDAVRTLAELKPAQARIIKEGRELSMPAPTVLPDDIVILRPGERVPVDGTVLASPAWTSRC